MSNFEKLLDETRVQCTQLDRFVDRYLPVRVQTQICQTLHNTMGINSRHRLQSYEIDCFKKLNNAVLGDQGVEYQKEKPIDLKKSI